VLCTNSVSTLAGSSWQIASSWAAPPWQFIRQALLSFHHSTYKMWSPLSSSHSTEDANQGRCSSPRHQHTCTCTVHPPHVYKIRSAVLPSPYPFTHMQQSKVLFRSQSTVCSSKCSSLFIVARVLVHHPLHLQLLPHPPQVHLHPLHQEAPSFLVLTHDTYFDV
jgi:hypothetical protein